MQYLKTEGDEAHGKKVERLRDQEKLTPSNNYKLKKVYNIDDHLGHAQNSNNFKANFLAEEEAINYNVENRNSRFRDHHNRHSSIDSNLTDERSSSNFKSRNGSNIKPLLL